MKPGPELDALIAEKVMGLDVMWTCLDVNPPFKSHNGPKYSTDISAAWKVIEKIKLESIIRIGDDCWCARTRDENDWPLRKEGYYEVRMYDDEHAKDYSFGETVQHAICLVALKTVGYKFE